MLQKSIQLPKHGESGFPQYEKSVGKHKHSKVMDFSNILCHPEIHTIPKTWGEWISIVREKYQKTQTFQNYIQLPKHEESGFPWYGKGMGKHKHSKVRCFSNILGISETDAIPKTWGRWISIVQEK